MTYKKLVSTKIVKSDKPELVYEALADTIVSKIYIHNPHEQDVRVKVYFVDKSNPDEYYNNQVNEVNTQAFDIIIPSYDTAIFGSGTTFTVNQCIYIKPIDNDVITHVFGKLVL